MTISRRHCLAALASLPVSLAMRAGTAQRDWRVLRETLADFARERRASGVGVAIRYGDETAYLNAGTSHSTALRPSTRTASAASIR